MLSNTGGNDRDNLSTGAVVVGNPKCANDTEVSAGVAVLSKAQASCDGFVSGGSGLVGWEAQDTGLGGMADVRSVADGTVFGVSPPEVRRRLSQKFTAQ
jgi:hypothetical protein